MTPAGARGLPSRRWPRRLRPGVQLRIGLGGQAEARARVPARTPACCQAAFVVGCTLLAWAVSQAEGACGNPEAPLVAEVLGSQIQTSDPDEMRFVILRKLTDRYATEQGIHVEPSEIDAYLKSVHRFMDEDRKRQEAHRQVIVRELNASGLTKKERRRLILERDKLNEQIAGLNGAGGGSAKHPDEDEAARERITYAFIRQWKINRALYREYGGRIIFQQGGPEPLDAYRTFLREQQKQGAFRILKKDFESQFWRYYVTDSLHDFYPAGSKEEANALQTPFWLSD
jgi:hypothetical protein